MEKILEKGDGLSFYRRKRISVVIKVEKDRRKKKHMIMKTMEIAFCNYCLYFRAKMKGTNGMNCQCVPTCPVLQHPKDAKQCQL